MRVISQDAAATTVTLGQLVADWCHELDTNAGLAASAFFTPDCSYVAGRISFRGVPAMDAFYKSRRAAVVAEREDGIRTARHMFTNLRVIVESEDRAEVTFLITNFSAFGPPPLRDATTPTIVSDVRLVCTKDARGEWKIAEFEGAPVMVGGDAFLNASLLGTEH